MMNRTKPQAIRLFGWQVAALQSITKATGLPASHLVRQAITDALQTRYLHYIQEPINERQLS